MHIGVCISRLLAEIWVSLCHMGFVHACTPFAPSEPRQNGQGIEKSRTADEDAEECPWALGDPCRVRAAPERCLTPPFARVLPLVPLPVPFRATFRRIND